MSNGTTTSDQGFLSGVSSALTSATLSVQKLTPDVVQNAILSTLGLKKTNQSSAPGAEMILAVRGAFYQFSVADNSSPGMYAIEELSRYLDELDTASGADVFGTDFELVPPVLLMSVEFNQMDITSEMPCLNNVKVFYTFGQNFGQVQIVGEVLLGPLGNDQQHNRGFRIIRDFFDKYRVSKYKLPVAVSIANETYFVYLKGLRIGQIDANYHTMPFVFYGTLLDISREDANKVNLKSDVVVAGKVSLSSLLSALQATQPDPLTIPTAATEKTVPIKSTSDTTEAPNPSPAGTSLVIPYGDPMAVIVNADVAGKTSDAAIDYKLAQRNIQQMDSFYAQNKAAMTPDQRTDFQNARSQLVTVQQQLGDQILVNANEGCPLSDVVISQEQQNTLSTFQIDAAKWRVSPENYPQYAEHAPASAWVGTGAQAYGAPGLLGNSYLSPDQQVISSGQTFKQENLPYGTAWALKPMFNVFDRFSNTTTEDWAMGVDGSHM